MYSIQSRSYIANKLFFNAVLCRTLHQFPPKPMTVRSQKIRPVFGEDKSISHPTPDVQTEYNGILIDPRIRPMPSNVLYGKKLLKFKQTMYHKIWRSLTSQNFSRFDKLFLELTNSYVPMDEVFYTLKLWGYVVSHRHISENAYLVLDEMKQADMHPVVVRMNQRMLESYMEMKNISAVGHRHMWQNICKLCWQSSLSLMRKRRKAHLRRLRATHPNEAIAILSSRDGMRLLFDDYNSHADLIATARVQSVLNGEDELMQELLLMEEEIEEEEQEEANELSDDGEDDDDEETAYIKSRLGEGTIYERGSNFSQSITNEEGDLLKDDFFEEMEEQQLLLETGIQEADPQKTNISEMFSHMHDENPQKLGQLLAMHDLVYSAQARHMMPNPEEQASIMQQQKHFPSLSSVVGAAINSQHDQETPWERQKSTSSLPLSSSSYMPGGVDASASEHLLARDEEARRGLLAIRAARSKFRPTLGEVQPRDAVKLVSEHLEDILEASQDISAASLDSLKRDLKVDAGSSSNLMEKEIGFYGDEETSKRLDILPRIPDQLRDRMMGSWRESNGNVNLLERSSFAQHSYKEHETDKDELENLLDDYLNSVSFSNAKK